jgi:ABC-2 type transport system ATP-binding protein
LRGADLGRRTVSPAMPPVIEARGLAKRFSEAVLAVDDLSFTVERGQVCGMLGPNGAGKTTTLRMLVGLLRPTAGEARLFDETMRPSGPQLTRVGSLIEEAAFAPYLKGITNLRLWWEAAGAHWSDADAESALAVAGLGTAIERKVKTYSHGMKQRLGIARALLARPEVLILDEPTTGLDPQEIREVRNLVRRLAERGDTILLSSHLLAEVEQTCSHLVVIDRGHAVSTGTVSELIGDSDRSVYLEVDDVEAAKRALSTLAGVRAVHTESDGLTVEIESIDRSELVAALVHAGVGVRTVTARRRLEDAFLNLVGEEHER